MTEPGEQPAASAVVFASSLRLPSGWSMRPVDVGDAEALCDLMAASAIAAVGEADVTLEEVSTELRDPTLDVAADTVYVHDQSGRAVAYVVASVSDAREATLDLYLYPEIPDEVYAQLGRTLLEAGKQRLRAVLSESGFRSLPVHAGAYRREPRLAALLEDVGMTSTRSFSRMRIALDRTVDLTAPAPMGVSIRTVGEEDLPVVHQTVEDSMRLHFGHVERDFESWMERRRSSAGFDLELWWLAFVDSHPAGVLLASDARADIGEGFVHILGVMTEYRGRGIAKAMLRVAFAEFAARGRPMVALGVDTQNADGATRLYESVGMRPIMVVDYFEMELSR